jgi:hypothetical protein
LRHAKSFDLLRIVRRRLGPHKPDQLLGSMHSLGRRQNSGGMYKGRFLLWRRQKKNRHHALRKQAMHKFFEKGTKNQAKEQLRLLTFSLLRQALRICDYGTKISLL